MIKVVADVHERASGVLEQLESLGVRIERRKLAAGDYVLGGSTVIERKSADDLHATIAEGRFWPQMGRLRDSARFPYLMIEGSPWRGSVGSDAIRGACLATSDLGIAVLRTDDAIDTARWIFRLACRRQEGFARDRPNYAQRPKRPRGYNPAEQALAAAPGVSTVTTRLLLRKYGSLHAVVTSNPEDWLAIPGIGPRRMASLASMIHSRWPSVSAH